MKKEIAMEKEKVLTKALLEKLYKKLQTEIANDCKTKNGCFKYFCTEVMDDVRDWAFKVDSKTLKNYYEKHVEEKNNNSGKPKIELRNFISQYLGYEDYYDFVMAHSKKEVPPPTQKVVEKETTDFEESFTETATKAVRKKKYSVKDVFIISTIVLTISTFVFHMNLNNKVDSNCYQWVDNHFVNVDCDLQKNTISDNTLIMKSTDAKKMKSINTILTSEEE